MDTVCPLGRLTVNPYSVHWYDIWTYQSSSNLHTGHSRPTYWNRKTCWDTHNLLSYLKLLQISSNTPSISFVLTKIYAFFACIYRGMSINSRGKLPIIEKLNSTQSVEALLCLSHSWFAKENNDFLVKNASFLKKNTAQKPDVLEQIHQRIWD